MDWAALGSREAVLAVCARFRVDFAQAEDYLLARQLGQAEERAEADEQEEEEEEEDDDEGEQEDEGTILPMPGQDLVSVRVLLRIPKYPAPALASLRPLLSRLYKWCSLCSLLH